MERLSIELTDRCDRACAFCYAHATAEGGRAWAADDVVALVRDCAANGTRAVSFGGGEPLQYPALADVLARTRGLVFRSLTTSGLLLDAALPSLVRCRPEKIHVSVHHPEDPDEVARVARQVRTLETFGIRGGVNLLVRRSGLDAARRAARELRAAGIANDRIVYLPMRLGDTPAAEEVAAVAEGPFQSATCLAGCHPSPRFASLDASACAAPCSYTRRRRRLEAFTSAALAAALDGLGIEPCGDQP